MAQVDDGRHMLPTKRRKGLVRERPIVLPRARVSGEIWWPIAKVIDPKVGQPTEVVTPAFVVLRLRELILADFLALPLNGWITILDTGGKHEFSHSRRDFLRKDVEAAAIDN